MYNVKRLKVTVIHAGFQLRLKISIDQLNHITGDLELHENVA